LTFNKVDRVEFDCVASVYPALHLVQREGDWAGPQPAQSPPIVPNVPGHPPMASVPINELLYNS